MKEITEDKGRVRPVVEGNFQCDENGNSTRVYEILSIVGIVDSIGKLSYISKKNVPIGTPITNEEYWYPFQVVAVPKGDKGDDGKSAYDLYIEHGGTITTEEEWLESLHGADGEDAISPILRISPDGLSIEISSDNGQTWLPFQKDFNKLRILGYVDSIAELPTSANIGDIYGVWNKDAQSGVGAYELYIQTVRNWLLDYTITKVYDYDTELPSIATNGTTVLVPVTDLTLDKEKVDGYKVYKFNLANNGWVMVLNTTEIYASKEDIINYGNNVYALVQGTTEGTYELYKRQVDWVYFSTNASITYHLIQDVQQGTDTNILSGKAVKDALDTKVDKEESKSLIDAEYASTKSTIASSEFFNVVVDEEDKIVWGIKTNGHIYYGAGVPQQIIDYINKKLAELSLDEYEDIVAFLSDYLGSDTTLKAMIDEINATKLDKDGLDPDALKTVQAIENPEYIQVATDSEDNILEGITSKGVKKINLPIDTPSATVEHIENPEWMNIETDIEGRIIEGTRKNGKKVFPGGIEGLEEEIQNTVNNTINTEFVNKFTTDKFSEQDNKLLWNGEPIESGSISSLVVDLPVSDGTDIDSGYAYIDITDRTIKVKA